jgi:hypothetical protein
MDEKAFAVMTNSPVAATLPRTSGKEAEILPDQRSIVGGKNMTLPDRAFTVSTGGSTAPTMTVSDSSPLRRRTPTLPPATAGSACYGLFQVST